MDVAGIALGMFRHARLQSLFIESMAKVTLRRSFRHPLRFHLTSHLLRVGVVAVRKTLEPELDEARRKANPVSLCIKRRFVTHDAHFAFSVGEVFRVTLNAGRMSGQ
jgi:hypothetical protein